MYVNVCAVLVVRFSFSSSNNLHCTELGKRITLHIVWSTVGQFDHVHHGFAYIGWQYYQLVDQLHNENYKKYFHKSPIEEKHYSIPPGVGRKVRSHLVKRWTSKKLLHLPGLQSVNNEQIDNNTFEIVNAGDQLSFKISKQITPWLFILQ